MTDEESSSDLATLTYDDLLVAIDEASDRARKTEVVETWNRLRQVVIDLAGDEADDGDHISGEGWSLERLEVSGFRGIGAQGLTIDFETTPGITVLRGPNGAGKSSIADAVEAALYGRVGGSHKRPSGRGGNAALWEPEYVADGCDEAQVLLVLRRNRERLHLRRGFGQDGVPTDHSASLQPVRAGDRPSRDVDLGRDWTSALDSNQPVFGYATWERRLQRAKDLQGFLDSLLALGGCFAAVESAVDRKRDEARSAYDRWKGGWNAAARSVAAVDEEYGDLITDPVPIVAPEVSEDINDWARTNTLDGTTEQTPTIGVDAKAAVDEASRGTLEEVRKHRELAGSVVEQLAGPLGSLHTASSSMSEETGRECPVCTTSDVDWFGKLSATVSRLEDRQPMALAKALGKMRSVVEEWPLPDVVKMKPVLDREDQATIESISELGTAFVTELDRHGSTVVTDAAVELAEELSGDEVNQLLQHCIERSDYHRQWRASRTEAVQDFLSIWREEQPEAEEHSLWSDVRDRLSYLHTRLRERRGEELKAAAAKHVSSLLDDAQVNLEGVTVQATKADLDLTQGEVSLTMGMLSAGQRNAVLLAPLLAVAKGGPFRFLVLDDPVHAFDTVRVDRLAQAIERLATRQRIIVLTHDERFYEHLVAADVPVDSHFVTRSPQSQTVTIEPRHEMWDTLLTDASSLLEQASSDLKDMPLGPTATVRGLCRQAVDHAVRTMVLRHERREGGDPEAALEELDAALTTRERLARANTRLASSSDSLDRLHEAKSRIGPYLGLWNEACHAPEEIEDLVERAEIDAARAACMSLTEQTR